MAMAKYELRLELRPSTGLGIAKDGVAGLAAEFMRPRLDVEGYAKVCGLKVSDFTDQSRQAVEEKSGSAKHGDWFVLTHVPAD